MGRFCLSSETSTTVALTPLAPISMPPCRLVCWAGAGSDQQARTLRASVGTRVVQRIDATLGEECSLVSPSPHSTQAQATALGWRTTLAQDDTEADVDVKRLRRFRSAVREA